MNCPLVREYLNLVDENGDNKGVVLPCDVFKQLKGRGLNPTTSAILSAILTVLGGSQTNPAMPFISRSDGPDREATEIPRGIDASALLKTGGSALLSQVISIAEALLIPSLTKGLQRNIPDDMKTRGVKKRQKAGGLLNIINFAIQNRHVIGTVASMIATRGKLRNQNK